MGWTWCHQKTTTTNKKIKIAVHGVSVSFLHFRHTIPLLTHDDQAQKGLMSSEKGDPSASLEVLGG